MALTDAKVRNAKLPKGKKSLKLSDAEGLFLFVTTASKTWRQNTDLNSTYIDSLCRSIVN